MGSGMWAFEAQTRIAGTHSSSAVMPSGTHCSDSTARIRKERRFNHRGFFVNWLILHILGLADAATKACIWTAVCWFFLSNKFWARQLIYWSIGCAIAITFTYSIYRWQSVGVVVELIKLGIVFLGILLLWLKYEDDQFDEISEGSTRENSDV